MVTEPTLSEARQAAHVAERFTDLQGLRQTVGAVLLFLLFAWEMMFPLSSAGARAIGIAPYLWSLAALAMCFGLMLLGVRWVSAWYRRQYGVIEQTKRQRRLGMLIGATGTLAFLVPFEVEIIANNGGHSLPFNPLDFTIAAWIVGYWMYLGRPYRHYLLFAGVGVVLGALSIAGVPPATFEWHVREATLYIALASAAGGIIDHRILTKALTPLTDSRGLDP